MRRVLVLNPNTSAAVTALVHGHVQSQLGGAATIHSVTARFGAPYIADEASYAVAAHAALDAWAAAVVDAPSAAPSAAPDAVLVACFGDPGVEALRDSSPAPVMGLAEAAFREARQAGPFAIVTGGARWAPMLHRLARTLGHDDALAGILTVVPTGAELAADPLAAHRVLADACRDAQRRFGARGVILGGAGLAGMAAAIQSQVEVPLIDSVAAGARWAMTVQAAPVQARPGFDVPWVNLSAEMAALGRG